MFFKNKKTGLKNDVKCHWTKDETVKLGIRKMWDKQKE